MEKSELLGAGQEELPRGSRGRLLRALGLCYPLNRGYSRYARLASIL
jgi:hypothetical protein